MLINFLKMKDSLNISSSVEEVFDSRLRQSNIAVIEIYWLDFDSKLKLAR